MDPVSNIAGHKIWLFSGTKDSLVSSATMGNVNTFYKTLGANVKFVNYLPAQHCFPTDDIHIKSSNPCGHLGAPYINYCNFDAVGDMFKHILPN